MATLSIVLLSACVSTILSCRYPSWPGEFKWSFVGPVNGYTCTRILAAADPNTWSDNYFCHNPSSTIQDVGMRWSSAGNSTASSRSNHTEVWLQKCL